MTTHEERFHFADSETGLSHALHITRSLRAAGFRTRLSTAVIKLGTGHTGLLHTVHGTPPTKPTRVERGCNILRRTP
jgi:hypothetical protein